MGIKGMKTTSGYLTVYLTLTITVMLSLYLALIEGARSNAIRLETECITDIGMNSVMAEYHRELYEQYNLFAIDTSYGTGQAGKANVEKHLREYLDRNTSAKDIFMAGFFYKDFLAMSVKKLKLTKVSILTDDDGAVFRRRAVEAIKDDVGISLMKDLAEWNKTVKDNQLNERDIFAEKREIDAEIQEYDGKSVLNDEGQWVTVEIENPTDALEELRNKGALQIVVEQPQSLSAKTISLENLIGSRLETGEINKGNWQEQKANKLDELTERFFFQEYLLKYMGRYGCVDEENALSYQVEYLISGKGSDLENLRNTINTLCAVREVANAVYLFGDEEKCAVAELLAVLLASLMMVPEISDLLKVTLLLGWAYAESLYDVEMLLKGERIPLIKDDSSWHYDLDSALALSGVTKEVTSGLSYEDYLRIFMSFTDLETLTIRAMNMVEADIRCTPGNQNFRLDACYDCIEAQIFIKSAFGYEYEITRQKKY